MFCPPCERDHGHAPRRLVTGRLEPDRYLMPQTEERQAGTLMVGALSAPGQERTRRARVSPEE
eukprot:7931147-Alexandrium_andersonii.AAC.1